MKFLYNFNVKPKQIVHLLYSKSKIPLKINYIQYIFLIWIFYVKNKVGMKRKIQPMVTAYFFYSSLNVPVCSISFNDVCFHLLQLIYKSNNEAHAQYQLSELELPNNRNTGRNFLPTTTGKTVIADMTNNLNAVSLYHLFR